MGKSLRSKVKRRWRKLKRGYLDQIVTKPQLNQLTNKLEATLVGIQYRKQQPKNAFLHPQDPTAQFAQYKPQPMIDLRSNAIPGSGLEYSGACRKIIKAPNPQILLEQEKEQIKINRGHIKKKKKPGKSRKTIVF